MHGRASRNEEVDTAGGHRARLRRRLLDAGPAGFHDYELIEYLLTLTIPRVDTKPLAKRLIDEFGGMRSATWRQRRHLAPRGTKGFYDRGAEDRRGNRA